MSLRCNVRNLKIYKKPFYGECLTTIEIRSERVSVLFESYSETFPGQIWKIINELNETRISVFLSPYRVHWKLIILAETTRIHCLFVVFIPNSMNSTTTMEEQRSVSIPVGWYPFGIDPCSETYIHTSKFDNIDVVLLDINIIKDLEKCKLNII